MHIYDLLFDFLFNFFYFPLIFILYTAQSISEKKKILNGWRYIHSMFSLILSNYICEGGKKGEYEYDIYIIVKTVFLPSEINRWMGDNLINFFWEKAFLGALAGCGKASIYYGC